MNIKKNHTVSFLLVMIAFISFAFFLSLTPKMQAQIPSTNLVSGTAIITPDNLNYPIYFSGPNANGGGVQYNTSGNLSGYAWSPAYGWLDFSAGLAKIDPTTKVMTGKARMISLQNPNDTESTEWADGVMTFKGTNGGVLGGISYGVIFNLTTGQGSGYAWGGNVIGWVDFSGVSIVPNPTGYSCTNNCSTPITGGAYLTQSACTTGCTTGYSCTNNCSTPITGGAYLTQSACTTACTTQGYSCTNNCSSLISGGQYFTQAACTTACTACDPLNPTYPACCLIISPIVPPATAEDVAACRKIPHYIED